MGVLYLSGDLLQDRKKLKVDKNLLDKKNGSPTPQKKCTSRNVWSKSRFKNDDLQRCHEFPTELPYLQITHLTNHLSTGSTWASRDSVPKTIYFRGVAAVLGVHLPMLDEHGSFLWQNVTRKKTTRNQIKLIWKGESVKRKKQNKKPPGPSCRGEFSAIQTNKPNDYEWCKSVTYTPRLQLDRWGPPGTLWSFHPDPCKNPPNMSKFHLQVFSFESLVTKLKRDDFFGGFRIVFDTTMEWIPPFPLCLMVVLLFGSFHPPFRQKDHGGILTTKIPFWKTNM